MIAKGKSISHGTAALEYDLAKEINGAKSGKGSCRELPEASPYGMDIPAGEMASGRASHGNKETGL